MDRKIGLFDAIRTMRAMWRWSRTRSRRAIREILEAAICAPSGGEQHWRFIVVKDPETKKQLQIRYKRAFEDLKARFHAAPPPPAKPRRKRIGCSWQTT